MDTVHVIKDLYYSDDSKSPDKKHHLDLFLPKNHPTKSPVVLFVHGGGWKRGDRVWFRGMFKNVGTTLAKEGIACALISYRLSILTNAWILAFAFFIAIVFSMALLLLSLIGDGLVHAWKWGEPIERVFFYEIIAGLILYIIPIVAFGVGTVVWVMNSKKGVKHPEHAYDVAKSLRWVIENADKYNWDKNQIFLMGHSAGGHLVSLLALDPTYIEYAGLGRDIDGLIKGVIPISGVYNLDKLESNLFFRYWYVRPAFHYEHLKEASPITHARKTKFPWLLINASFDFHLPKDAKELAAKLKQAGTQVETVIVPKTTHGTVIANIGTSKDTTSPHVLDFIRKVLAGEHK
eukprot:TRINITY_DN2134_c0_g1_i3.p1 TRINITY_DN2134_c0_g1~~TRINITY_DN2134_c0_g1_i3.p1  ORF type:complete len:348 (+),score=68.60 TRINITY_DN2134_c0_g1_i3:116-1159(+)